MFSLTGCQAVVNPYDARIVPPVPEEMAIGREQSKVSLPAYRIEPPDVVSIEMLKLESSAPPYRAGGSRRAANPRQRPAGPAD